MKQNVNSDVIQCQSCNKHFTRVWSLNRHQRICKQVDDPLICSNCKEKFENRMAKSRHVKDCAKSETAYATAQTAHTIQNINNNINNNITINNNQSTTNNTLALKYPGLDDEDFDFDRQHITDKRLNVLWNNAKPEIGFYKFANAILENPKNRYVRKTDAKSNSSSVHMGDGDWDLMLDKDVFTRLTFDMSVSALGAYNDHKKKLRLVKTSLDRIFQYLDNVNTEQDPDFSDAVQRLKLIVISRSKQWMAEENA